MPERADATTMSMLGPVTCSALTVIDPVFPPLELDCSLTMTLMPPGTEMARFGFAATIGVPATVRFTSSELPVRVTCVPLQAALALHLTASAAMTPPRGRRFATGD